jgi:hypothetical protein
MKTLKTFLLLLLVSSTSALSAQEVIKNRPCNDTSIKRQADSLRQLYARDGFKVLKETSMAMESEYEMPIIVPLQQNTSYQIVFIGEITSKLYEVRMYDYDEKMVSYQKKQWGDVDGNIISFTYTPKFSELHMIKPVQVNKKKKKAICGYVMLLVKTK